MIKVKISYKDNLVKQIIITGHACYSECGKDIVCSAVSSIVTTTVNAILMFDENYICYLSVKDKFVIDVKVNNEIVTAPTSIRIAQAGNYSGMIGASLLALGGLE